MTTIVPNEASGCQGKVAYKSAACAKRAARHIRPKRGFTLSAYKCIFCGFFHVGNSYNIPHGRDQK